MRVQLKQMGGLSKLFLSQYLTITVFIRLALVPSTSSNDYTLKNFKLYIYVYKTNKFSIINIQIKLMYIGFKFSIEH